MRAAPRRFEHSLRLAEIITLQPIPRQRGKITAAALSRAFVNSRVGFRNSITGSPYWIHFELFASILRSGTHLNN